MTPLPGAATVAPGEVATQLSGSATFGSPGRTGPLTVGQNFGTRYHIIKQLGVGGMGAVYQAWDSELGVAVALKVVRPDTFQDPEDAQNAERRFKQELLLAREVTHRNVVRIHDLGEMNGVKFISMPYIQGSDLDAVLRKTGKLAVERMLAVARQVAAGLAAAHDAGVIHRDLKPGNIMLDADDRAFIMDFGISRPASAATATATRSVMGTIEYMAPEQALGHRPDARTDMYAFGLIMYDMLAGLERLHGRDTGVAELMGRMSQAPPALRSLNPEVPEPLEQIVMRCVEPDPNQRYQTTQELLAALESLGPTGHVRAGTTVLHGRATPRFTLKGVRAAGRTRRLVAAAVVLVLLAAAVAYFFRDRFGVGRPPAAAPGRAVALALLPFRNASGDPSLDWVGTSLTEALRGEMGHSSHLRTVPSERVHQILRDLRLSANAHLDPGTVRKLGDFSSADTVLWGQYLKFGPAIRIDATLTDLKGDRTISLQAQAANETVLLAAVSDLAEKVRGNLALAPDIVKELKASALKPSTRSVQALRFYNEGIQLARDGKHSEAVKRFEAATEEDSGFALAYSKLAQTYGNLGYDDKADRAARTSVELSDGLSATEKHLIQANHARLRGDTKTASAAYENLLKASPEDVQVRFELARLYEDAGALDQARQHYAHVLARDPKYVDALLATGRVEVKRGDPAKALEPFNHALTLVTQFENEEQRATVLQAVGNTYYLLNRPSDALLQYEQSLAIRERINDRRGIAASLNQIAQVQRRLGKDAEALASYRRALALQREIGDKRGIAGTLLNLGVFHSSRSAYDDALGHFKEALQIQREVGNQRGQALCLNNIGNVYLSKGLYVDARTYFELALDLRERLKAPVEIAQTLHNLAETSAKLAEYDTALRHYLRALELYRGASDRRAAAIESYSLATLFEYQGRYGAALKAREEALQIFKDLRERSFWTAEITSGHGRALSLVGRRDEAKKALDEGLALARTLKNQTLVAQALNFHGDDAFYQGDYKAARADFEQALRAASTTTDRHAQLVSRVNLAKVAVAEGKGRTVVDTLQRLAAEADQIGLRYTSIECSLYLGEALIAAKQYPAAVGEIDKALLKAEKLGSLILVARARHMLGRLGQLAGDAPAARRHFTEAGRAVHSIRNDAGDGVMSRADLRAIQADLNR